jgi:hypothetical protein
MTARKTARPIPARRTKPFERNTLTVKLVLYSLHVGGAVITYSERIFAEDGYLEVK